MKQWKQVSAVAAAAMALVSGGAQALGLGTPNSRAILGESLRISVPLELETGEDTDDGCPQAEVYYGDGRVDAGKVILGVSPQSGRHRVLTVRAIQPINEPLIEVSLSYGCGARLSRKFTIFASPPEFVPTVVLRPATTSEPATDARVSEGAAASLSGTRVATASAVRAEPTVPRAVRPVPVRRPAKVAAPAPAPRPKAPPAPPPAGRPGTGAGARGGPYPGAHAGGGPCFGQPACLGGGCGAQGLFGRFAQARTGSQAGPRVASGARSGCAHGRHDARRWRQQCGFGGAAQSGHFASGL